MSTMLRWAASVAVVLVATGCAGSDKRSAPTAAPRTIVTAPTPCPHGIVRASVAKPAELSAVTDGHFPHWLPDGFGLSGVYQNGFASWSDGRCREVSVAIGGDGPRPTHGPTVGAWTVVTDAEGQCGNAVLGKARCLGYEAKFGNHLVSVQMMGMERDQGDKIVESIG